MSNLAINPASDLPRPNRLNAAGWCRYCSEWRCESARCIQTHQRTHWGLCDDCYGTQHVGAGWWCVCTDGMTEYANPQAAAESWALLRHANREERVSAVAG